MVTEERRISSFLWLNSIPWVICYDFFHYSPANGHFFYWLLWVVLYWTVEDQYLWHSDFISYGNMPRTEVVDHREFQLQVSEAIPSRFLSLYWFAFTQVVYTCLFSTSLSTLAIFSLFDKWILDHWDTDLYIPEEWWYWEFSFVPVSLLCNFFWEMLA